MANGPSSFGNTQLRVANANDLWYPYRVCNGQLLVYSFVRWFCSSRPSLRLRMSRNASIDPLPRSTRPRA